MLRISGPSILLLLASTLLSLLSCNTDKKQNANEASVITDSKVTVHLTPGTMYDRLSSANGRLNYALYVPAGYSPASRLPAIIFADPQANGQLPLSLYQKIADRYHYLLIGSLDSRNGMSMDQSTAIIRELVGEAVNTIGADRSSVSLMGFSGGAKAILAAAAALPGINSVTYCGAAFPQGSFNVPVPTLGIAGLFDMNFTEVLYFAAALDSTPGKNAFLLSAAKHEWPDSTTFKRVIAWDQSSRCRNGNRCDTSALKELKNEIRKDLNRTTDPVWLDFDLRFFVSAFTGIFDIQDEEKKRMSNTASAAYNKSLQQFIDDINRESEGRKILSQAFAEKDLDWWQVTVDMLRKKPNDLVNKRLLGYISLGAYTYSRKSVDAGSVENAAKYLRLYRMADPENPEWAFLSACLEERNGNRRNAMTFLEKAVQLGLKDTAKMNSEPLLSSAHGDAKFEELIARAAR